MSLDVSEIAPGLWMGSMPPFGRTLARAGIDVLVLCACEHQPTADYYPGVDIARIPLSDDGTPPSREEIRNAITIAKSLAWAIRDGLTVSVTCLQGRNRSGLIAALTFMRMTGCSGKDAMRAVQSRRLSPFGPALSNPEFNKILCSFPEKRSPGIITTQAAAAAGLTG